MYRRFLLAELCMLLAATSVSSQPEKEVLYGGWYRFELSPLQGTAATAKITAVARKPETMEVFWVGADGSVQDAYWYENATWQRFELAPPGSASTSGGITVVSRKPETMEVFWVGADGSIQDAYWYENATWQRFELAPPGSASTSGGITVVSRKPETMDVFWVGTDGSVQDAYWYENATWQRFELASPGSASTSGGLTVASRKPETMEVFWVGADGSVQDAYWYENATWQRLAPPLASPGSASTSGGITVVSRKPETMEVFWIGADGSVQDNYWYENATWQRLAPLAPPLASPGLAPPGSASMQGGITAVARRPQTMEVYWVGANGSVQYAFWFEWASWQMFELAAQGAASTTGGIKALSRIAQSAEIFWIGPESVQDAYWYDVKPLLPCSFPIIGTPPSVVAGPVAVPTVLVTERLGQLTGNADPQDLPHINNTDAGKWQGAGVGGVDLGANTEHNGRLYIFFGDTVPGNGDQPGPPNPVGVPKWDTDLVAWTEEWGLRPGGFALHPVKNGDQFYPFSVDSGIGTLPTNRTPTGAFTYKVNGRERVYVFALWNDPSDPHAPNADPFPTTILASTEDPGQPGPYHKEFTFSKCKFWGVQPTVVKNAEHAGLPETEGDGLVILAGGCSPPQAPGGEVHLAWMRLDPNIGPVASSTRYYTGNPGDPWTKAENDQVSAFNHESEAKPVINLPPWYSTVSATWFADAKQWIVLYNKGTRAGLPTPENPNPRNFPWLPVVARFGPNPWSWTHEVEIFNPCREAAYGNFMHWPGLDDINSRVLPDYGPDQGSAYGALVMPRFSVWDPVSRELSLAYLMSTWNPYQVQVMRTRLWLPRHDTIEALRTARIDFSVRETDLRQWLGNTATLYPSLANALLEMLDGKRLKQPVYIDVIAWNYEHMTGQANQAYHANLDLSRLKAAVIEGYNMRYGTNWTEFEGLIE
jgi:hypothetical protein